MKFQIKNGTELSVDLEQWKKVPNYLTEIVGETELDYRLSNEHKLEIDFPKEGLTSNVIPVTNNQVLLTEYLYGHFFGGLERQRNNQIESEVRTSFAKIVAHKELVWSRAEYFLIRAACFDSGPQSGGDSSMCLGALLESWFSSDELLIQNLFPEGDLYIVNFGGSFSSGAYFGNFWSMEKNEFVYKNNRTNNDISLPGTVLSWIKKLWNIADKYPVRMGMNTFAIQKLLQEISELEGSSV